jgi:hypothetical protein
MRIAVARDDFSVLLMDESGKATKPYQVANGEDLKLATDRITGVVRKDGAYPGGVSVVGYIVEIEGQRIFVDERLLEVSG